MDTDNIVFKGSKLILNDSLTPDLENKIKVELKDLGYSIEIEYKSIKKDIKEVKKLEEKKEDSTPKK